MKNFFRNNLVILYTILLISLISCQYGKSESKPDSVPENAVYIGGKDGGVWVYLKQMISKNQFKIAIYTQNGDFFIQDVFSFDCNCFQEYLSGKELFNTINAFDGQNFILNFTDTCINKYCYLKALNPIQTWPTNIPNDAKWFGDMDRGLWLSLKQKKEINLFSISMFNISGQKVVENDFIIEDADSSLFGINTFSLIQSVKEDTLKLKIPNKEACFNMVQLVEKQ